MQEELIKMLYLLIKIRDFLNKQLLYDKNEQSILATRQYGQNIEQKPKVFKKGNNKK